jgi:prepilin-type N-terminal cleavage/methylation domain-containing protein
MNVNLTTRARRTAFTLVELMIVIGIIAVLAAMIFPAGAIIKRKAALGKARTELKQLELAIGAYKTKYGFYPPDNRNNLALNTLYYELRGTKLVGSTFVTLDESASISIANVRAAFGSGIEGFMNCTRGGGDDAVPAQDFFKDVKQGQYVQGTNNSVVIRVLTTSVVPRDSDPSSLPAFSPTDPPGNKANPWRYNSSNPTNNPGQFDLWVDIITGGKTNRVSNWSARPQIVNNP